MSTKKMEPSNARRLNAQMSILEQRFRQVSMTTEDAARAIRSFNVEVNLPQVKAAFRAAAANAGQPSLHGYKRKP